MRVSGVVTRTQGIWSVEVIVDVPRHSPGVGDAHTPRVNVVLEVISL
jgi:hypothetical protein